MYYKTKDQVFIAKYQNFPDVVGFSKMYLYILRIKISKQGVNKKQFCFVKFYSEELVLLCHC